MLTRWLRFLAERYAMHVAVVVLWAIVIDLVAQYYMKAPRVHLSRVSILVAVAAVLMGAAARVTDDFKDAAVDREFFPDRPLIAGRVSSRDLIALAVTSVLAAAALSAVWRLALLELAVAAAYLYLMTRWFFLPRLISGNRILAIATHFPFYFLLYLYVASSSATFHQLRSPAAVPYALAGWMVLPFLSYEFARKTLVPTEERQGLQTYSSMLGFRLAGTIGFAFAAGHFAILLLGLSCWRRAPAEAVIGLALLLVAYAAVLLRFVALRCRRTDELSLASGAYHMGALVLLVVGTLRIG